MLIPVALTLSSLAAMLLLIQTTLALRRYRYTLIESQVDDLPTVSVCIAARNETHALAQCLERVLNSDYKKLEVLVLDDSSNDDTSLIIKSFAQAGVRFIAGTELPNGWLGRNHAFQTLMNESSGDYLLFLDVDTIIKYSTISQLVPQLEGNGNKAMLSVLPRREDGYRLSALFGTMRYYWELLLSSPSRPPAASAIWMVRRNALDQSAIGLETYGLSVRPERHLARLLHKLGAYTYIVGSRSLGVSYEKRLHSQYETALRLYYPLTGRKVAKWFIASVFLGFLIAPIAIFFSSTTPIYVIWSVILLLICMVSFGLFIYRTHSRNTWVLRVFLGPLLIIQELVLLCVSYWQYINGKVTWKGRSVTAGPIKHEALRVDE